MRTLFGGLLLGIGILIMTCSGLCSLYVVAIGFPALFQEPFVILFPLIVGGIPFAIGYGLYRLGRRLLRPPLNSDTEGGL